MKIAVIIPSRLQPNPLAEGGRLYLDRAIGSVRRQTVSSGSSDLAEILVGVSQGDSKIIAHDAGTRIVLADIPGQVAALNAAVSAAGDFDALAFLEDDDTWESKRLEYGLAALEQGFDFVSSNQRETDIEGNYIRVNDFATPSGWMLTRRCWEAVGPFDASFKWHLDNEWLGRLGEPRIKIENTATMTWDGPLLRLSRLHFVEAGADKHPRRPWLDNVMRFSQVATTAEDRPLVNRTVNPEGGMARIAKDPMAAAESAEEHRRLVERFGCIPW